MAYYYTRDHLGSTREMCNSSGAIVARYSYDPYGRTTLVSGSNLATFQYARLYAHQPSGLDLPVYRGGYDLNTGRWIQRDRFAENGGINLYDYVHNNPLGLIDPFGLEGKWTFVIQPDDKSGGRPNIHVTYTMSPDEHKCCDTVVIQRWVEDMFGFTYWKDNDAYQDGITGGGAANIPATPGEDQPGGLAGGQNNTPTVIPRDFHFKWCAICASGKLKGQTLSCQERTYFSSWYNGAWNTPQGLTFP